MQTVTLNSKNQILIPKEARDAMRIKANDKLEMGDMDAVQWIQRIYPTKTIIEVCESSRKVSLKSRNFWRIWFGYKHAADGY